MKNLIFVIFRHFARLFSGSGLRVRFPLIDKVYKGINQYLSPKKVVVFENTIYLDQGDSMGLALHGIYEPIETQVVLEQIKPGFNVLDIGANIGYYTLIFAKMTGASGKVIAFEPEPGSFELLKKNIRANHYDNVLIEQKAVSDVNGSGQLRLDYFNNLDHRIVESINSRQDVPIVLIRLDDYLPEKFEADFIKMDIQGAEGLALRGMRQVLMRSAAVKILTEYWPKGLDASGVGAETYLQELNALGFSFFDVGTDERLEKTLSIAQILRMYLPNPEHHTNLICIRE